MDKIWLKHYPPGVPEEADIDRYTSLVDLFAQSAAAFADRPAFTSGATTLTYQEVDRLSAAFARTLAATPGLAKGERLGVMLPNLLQYPIAVLGALRAGLVVVNINPMYTARELGHQLRDAGCKALVTLDSLLPLVEQAQREPVLEHVFATRPTDLDDAAQKPPIAQHTFGEAKRIRVTDLLTALAQGEALDAALPAIASQDIAFLQYTGGTTGVSKGAILTHRNMVANCLQTSAWHGPLFSPGDELVITALPLYHIFALSTNFLLFVKYGGHNVLIANPRDMPGFVATLAKYKFSAITGVNTLYNGLLHTPGFAELDFSRLKIAWAGGTATQRQVARRWQDVTGIPLSEGYGLSETSPTLTSNHVSMGFTGTIGMPVPSTLVEIRDPDDRALAPNEIGEICAKGPQVMQGYWNRPDESAAAFAPGGWFRTGDIGLMDERGMVRITDRKKDMVLVSGFNVYPNEVEAIVAEHPGVFECAVIGVPDAGSGEAVKAVVVKRDPAVTEEDIRTHCRQQLTAYKVPRFVEFRDALPKSPVGKILRRELRQT